MPRREPLAVDAVLSIGEHGKYPVNAKGQPEYPRKRFFDEIVAVFQRSGRVVPVFNDKHLSYRWDWAQEMYDTARQLKIPLMAGSSVPLAERRPPLELAAGAKISRRSSIHGGAGSLRLPRAGGPAVDGRVAGRGRDRRRGRCSSSTATRSGRRPTRAAGRPLAAAAMAAEFGRPRPRELAGSSDGARPARRSREARSTASC